MWVAPGRQEGRKEEKRNIAFEMLKQGRIRIHISSKYRLTQLFPLLGAKKDKMLPLFLFDK